MRYVVVNFVGVVNHWETVTPRGVASCGPRFWETYSEALDSDFSYEETFATEKKALVAQAERSWEEDYYGPMTEDQRPIEHMILIEVERDDFDRYQVVNWRHIEKDELVRDPEYHWVGLRI